MVTSAILYESVAGSFGGADDAISRYSVSVEVWQAEFAVLKELEEDVGSAMRDHEILFVHPFLTPRVVSRRQ